MVVFKTADNCTGSNGIMIIRINTMPIIDDFTLAFYRLPCVPKIRHVCIAWYV